MRIPSYEEEIRSLRAENYRLTELLRAAEADLARAVCEAKVATAKAIVSAIERKRRS